MSLKERRKFLRVNLNTEVRIAGPEGAVLGILKNMSLGGAGIFIKTPIGKLKDVIEMDLPHPEEGILTLGGEIVGVRNSEEGQFLGVRFFRQTNATLFENKKRLREISEKSPEGRRNYPRVPNRLLIQCKTPTEFKAMLENISMGGFSLTMNVPMEMHQEITVEIPHPKTKKLLPLTGRVIHQKPVKIQGASRYQVGFEFQFLTAEQRNELSLFLDALISEPLIP